MKKKLEKSINQFNKACEGMAEYINAFDFMLPMGDGAKEMAIKEWKECINNVVIQLNNIKNMQIEILRNDKQ